MGGSITDATPGVARPGTLIVEFGRAQFPLVEPANHRAMVARYAKRGLEHGRHHPVLAEARPVLAPGALEEQGAPPRPSLRVPRRQAERERYGTTWAGTVWTRQPGPKRVDSRWSRRRG